MNKRKTIYKGFYKRKKRREIKLIVIALSILLIGGGVFIRRKGIDVFGSLTSSVSTLKSSLRFPSLIPKGESVTEYAYEDLKEELDDLESIETSEYAAMEDIKVATIDGCSMYSIQVASIQEGGEDLNKIEEELRANKIPFSITDIDGLKKVQTYGSVDKDVTREYMEDIRGLYPDAFLAEVNIPVLSLEYTSKYSYVEEISTHMNRLIDNYKEESEFWSDNRESVNMELYNEIITSRKQIVSELEEQVNNIEYEEMAVFKDNLIIYINDVDEKADLAIASMEDEMYNNSQGLFMSCIYGYLEFINSIREA